jgi:hypothetical protein
VQREEKQKIEKEKKKKIRKEMKIDRPFPNALTVFPSHPAKKGLAKFLNWYAVVCFKRSLWYD